MNLTGYCQHCETLRGIQRVRNPRGIYGPNVPPDARSVTAELECSHEERLVVKLSIIETLGLR